MIIFGQGALRCHPCAYDEIAALSRRDMTTFDKALWKHVALVLRNGARSVLLSITRGRLAERPVDGPAGRYLQKLSWVSATFATLADLAMATLGGSLKRRESLCGRLADMLAWMYLGACVVRRFEAEGRRTEDVPLMRWSMEHVLERCQSALVGVLTNFPVPVVGFLLRGPVAAWARMLPFGNGPSDELGTIVARRIQQPSAHRDRLTAGIHVPTAANETLARLERALSLAHQCDGILARVREAVKERKLPKGEPEHLVDEAVAAGILGLDEAALVHAAAKARVEAVQVDSFPVADFAAHVPVPAGSG
jgi:acyl-CoA dehydrogenase